jgi:hypothetical protein
MVRPIISFDAAHLRREYKSMLYIAIALSGGDDIYPIGFMIANGNEDRKTWRKMLGLLKEAFPIIFKEGFPTVLMVKNVNVHPRSQFVFTFDRGKGLKPALKEVFPSHIKMSCVKHIEANVTTKFKRKCGKHVMAMAKAYSVCYYDTLLDQMHSTKASAASNIEDKAERGILWSNLQ